MALDQKLLERELKKVLDTPQDTYLKAAQSWSRVFAKYAAGATSCGGQIGPTTPAEKVLTASLYKAFSTSKEVSAWTQQVSLGLATFWGGPPLVFIPTPPATPGVVTTPLPAIMLAYNGALIAVMLKNFARIQQKRPVDTPEAATDIAKALHTATTTILVTHPNTPPAVPPCVAPIA